MGDAIDYSMQPCLLLRRRSNALEAGPVCSKTVVAVQAKGSLYVDYPLLPIGSYLMTRGTAAAWDLLAQADATRDGSSTNMKELQAYRDVVTSLPNLLSCRPTHPRLRDRAGPSPPCRGHETQGAHSDRCDEHAEGIRAVITYLVEGENVYTGL